jgi:tetratricopeptide (TPR) repeat protein
MNYCLQDYEVLRDRGWKALTRGDVQMACREYEQALVVARHCADEDEGVVDKAEVNLAMARVQAHQDDVAEKGLREVLLRSSNAEVIRVAAQALAKILSHRHEHDKAHRFALLALEKAEEIGEPLQLFSCRTLMGLTRLNQSYLAESLEHYEAALQLLEEHPHEDPAEQAYYWALTADNIGYVLVLKGDLQEGRLRLEAAYERARNLGITDLVAEITTDLCFVHLRLGELDTAQEFGERALNLAENHGYEFFRRNCYYLLGEVASQRGDDAEADNYFRKLSEFYPQFAFLGDFLKEFDISSMINLKEFA